MIGLFLFSCKKNKAARLYEQAYELEEQGRFEEAIALLDQALELEPSYKQALLDRALDKAILEDYAGGISDLNQLIVLHPEGIEPYVWRAEYKRMLEEYEDALRDAEYALRLKNPKFTEGRIVSPPELDFEHPYIKKDRFDIELEYILYERAASNFHLGNFEAALPDLDRCIQQKLNPQGTSYYRGMTLIALGYQDEGCHDLRLASAYGDEEASRLINDLCALKKGNEQTAQ